MTFNDWILKARERTASDLHLESETRPVIRIRGELLAIGESISAVDLVQMGKELLDTERWNRFIARGSADLSKAVDGTQCRINVFKTLRGIGIAARLLTASGINLSTCNLHPGLAKLMEAQNGLVILSGPTGCGKSTTLAALIEEVNASRARNIITLESPIEYIFSNRLSFIRQREIPTHSPSFEQALVDALRENPDILIVTEMRTPEVMRLTLNAAETGHLVLATMHSATCAEALSRICMSFGPEIQGSILAQLADCIVGVVCQRLEFLGDYDLQVPKCEVLRSSSATKGTIKSGQFNQIASVLQTGADQDMWSFDRYERWIAQRRDWVIPEQTGHRYGTRGTASLPGARHE